MVAGMELPRDIEMGPKMQACAPQERLFVWFVAVEGFDATNAARKAGYVDNDNGAIRVRGHALMHRERVIEALEEVGRKSFRSLLPTAIAANRKLLENDKHPDHHKAVQSTLSRLGLSERTAVDVTMGGEVTVNHTDAAVNDLRTLLALQVPREKLIELFGFSGLERYEKMLADADRRVPKVIEHQEQADG
jgi:phage terminase small subunit